MRVLVIHGPNLGALGTREPEIYGTISLADIDRRIESVARELGAAVTCLQFNGEGEIVDAILAAVGRYDAIVVNPAAFTHYAYAIRDAIAAVDLPVIEVHLTNPHGRGETFRKTSVVADVCRGTIAGFGGESYVLALHALMMEFSSIAPRAGIKSPLR